MKPASMRFVPADMPALSQIDLAGASLLREAILLHFHYRKVANLKGRGSSNLIPQQN
jgi:hypothetical protein